VTTFEPDDAVPDVVRPEAEGSGMSPDQVDAAVRRVHSPTVLDWLSERNRLDEVEAMTVALLELTAHREVRRNLPLTGDEFAALVRAAPQSTADDVSITRDGRRLDSSSAVVEWLADVDADRAADRYVDFDEP
jgi:hypothetical protein